MSNKQNEQWEKTRSKGKMSFIILRCVLGWGLPVGIIYSILTHWDKNITTVIQSIIIFMICGFIFGTSYWMFMERKFQVYVGLTVQAVFQKCSNVFITVPHGNIETYI